MYRFVRKLPYHKDIVWREPYLAGQVKMLTVTMFKDQPPIPHAEELIRREVDWHVCREVQSKVWQGYRAKD
jgi:hypothetical protein